MAMARLESHVREGLLAASDAVIEDAVTFADSMVLRGLLYQLTGDEEVRCLIQAVLAPDRERPLERRPLGCWIGKDPSLDEARFR